MANAKQITVYIPMAADLIHPGHIAIIRAGAKLGTVIIGLGTDDAIFQKKAHQPVMAFDDRRLVLESIKGVDRVIPQTSTDYRPNLIKLKPAYVVHGNDWSVNARQQIINTISDWGGELIELPYTTRISSTELRRKAREIES